MTDVTNVFGKALCSRSNCKNMSWQEAIYAPNNQNNALIFTSSQREQMILNKTQHTEIHNFL